VTTILCPTRGGEASGPNQAAAVRLAAERSARLVFLYVSNVHFLDHSAGPIDLTVIESQLDEVGDFILTIAEEKAEARGVETEGLVLRGDFRTALEQVIEDTPDIAAVVFGSAQEDSAATTPDYIETLYAHLVKEHQVEVFVAKAGEIILHLKPDHNAPHNPDPDEVTGEQ
jgi:hypothetical protein